ncbi:family 2 encapsulin nanocompartment cargo protein polyprenyl transferase [Actinophytocola glycyrrhizae]|uniref:Family 2 encapsulin nanocompartment cargo protein polyprenyl transferase n=1 Tax=Actinophytocola glycyrrhizae TaxID=2044873 RepID=A0ABV9SC59_9PSEU
MVAPERVNDTEQTLAWSRELVDPALRSAVDTLPASMRRIAGYHLGWWDQHGGRTSASSGKAVRPTLTLLCAALVGGSPKEAVPAGVAVELVHNFSLLHDDVMDGDLTRRHRPTAWSLFGIGAAILAGDALLTLALDALAASAHPAAGPGMRMLSAAVQELVDGQCADMEFEQRSAVDLAECQHMAQGKTAALMGAACALGATFGGGSQEQVGRLRTFGEHVGLAFQHVDDLLGIWGDERTTGKPVYSDLRNRKKSLPVVYALTSGTPEARELAAMYAGGEPPTDEELRTAANLVDRAGGRAWSQEQADDLMARALAHLAHLPPTPSATELTDLAHHLTHRTH